MDLRDTRFHLNRLISRGPVSKKGSVTVLPVARTVAEPVKEYYVSLVEFCSHCCTNLGQKDSNLLALAGNYVNFGVFELYGDRALADALDIALKMTLSIPLADILAFRKLTRAYFAFLEVLFSTHIVFILNLDTSTFMHIVGSLESGLKGLDTNISSQCAAAVDFLAGFYFNNITVGEPPTLPTAMNLARHIAEGPNLFPEILKTLFEIVLFEDCGNQWSLSRPMLSLILINEQIYSDLKGQILASQPADQRPRLALCFDKLMADVTRSLDSKNRDKFTQNLTVFRHEFRVK
ncbi:hypothetical protein ACLOJK_024916 [Asimina triloba]